MTARCHIPIFISTAPRHRSGHCVEGHVTNLRYLWLRGESRHASTDDVRHRGGDLLMSGLPQATGTLAQDARLDLVDPVYRGYYKRSGPGFACVIGSADLPAGQSPAKMTKPYPGAFFRVAILSSRGFR
jgi:hypothetical protein